MANGKNLFANMIFAKFNDNKSLNRYEKYFILVVAVLNSKEEKGGLLNARDFL